MPQWIPLESNPELLTRYSRTLGLPSTYCLTEVLSPDLLDMVPKPRRAIIFLFPLTLPIPPSSQQQPQSSDTNDQPMKTPFFMKQTIGNACGTIALLHAFCNNMDALDIKKGSFVDKYYEEVKGKNAKERGAYLEKSKELDKIQDGFARQGQTSAPNADEKVDLHFVCFVECEGWLYELDGRREEARRFGKCDEDELLEKSFKVIQDSYMKLDPKESKFSVLALTPDSGY